MPNEFIKYWNRRERFVEWTILIIIASFSLGVVFGGIFL